MLFRSMFRFRRYRVFLILAIIAVVLFVRLNRSKSWSLPKFENFEDTYGRGTNHVENTPIKTQPPTLLQDEADDKIRPPAVRTRVSTSTSTQIQAATSTAASLKSTPKPDPLQVPDIVLPDRKPIPPTSTKGSEDELHELHAIAPPGRQEIPTFEATPAPIHWVKQPEHFPVPTGELIHLPSGKQLKMPRIQHVFNDETPDAKLNREKRQTEVRKEFLKAWGGYKAKAWLHDELMPETGSFKDPFCGWAATLVDGLDTLWIMGLQDEFEDAVKAVETLDFTTSPRGNIPVFETTIRYLGGLIAAYDVSEQKYKILLDKAVELAEVLMGAFDTPNRMPKLFYQWKPTFASQPKRADVRSNLAELGSLSMEFTRLAQITLEPKYYDAVARITNALSEWQDRGTALGSVFPDNVDASGCNRTAIVQQPVSASGTRAIVPGRIMDPPVGYKPDVPNNVPEPRPNKRPSKDGDHDLELQIVEGQPGVPGKGRIAGWEESDKGLYKSHSKRDEGFAENLFGKTTPTQTIDPITGLPPDVPAAKASVGAFLGDWDCHPQGLEPSSPLYSQKFSMGGGQDSTYEYYTKQHLLLGGLEPVYKKMYLKTIEDVRKYMLYRPMVPDNRDILFSGSVTTKGNPEKDAKLSADVEHLTCFIGGMVGMAAKVFDLDKDLEIAKRLTDGCVWAYESTASGIMPEGATVMPCESVQDCKWNQTAYYLFMDPMATERDVQVQEYLDGKVVQEALEAEAQSQKKIEDEAKGETIPEVSSNTTTDYDTTDPSRGSESLKKDEPISLQKRQDNPKNDVPKPITHNFKDDVPAKSDPPQSRIGQKSPQKALTPAEKMLEQKSANTQAELDDIASGGRQATLTSAVIPKEPVHEVIIDPWKPMNHTEYVKSRLEREKLPPGFVNMNSKKYILRPEAIESVWYMYRITGDPTWQDKGWKMFQAIINATSVQYGHAAVYDVTDPHPFHSDSMESFWLAETLKYFYLLFSGPEVVSLDEYVLNTEAHPFLRPT